MAVHAAYTILILPLHSSREALTFYLWLRRMKELEQERDALLDGVQLVDKARDWYRERLHEAEQKREWQCTLDQAPPPPLLGSALLVQIQEVNKFLNDLISYPEKGHRRQSPYSTKHSDTIASLRYQNQLLTREISIQNERMWKLQRENEALYRELRIAIYTELHSSNAMSYRTSSWHGTFFLKGHQQKLRRKSESMGNVMMEEQSGHIIHGSYIITSRTEI